jgi:uncharacterized membrane protein YccC
MKSVINWFKKYPRSAMFIGIALLCGAGWVSGMAGFAVAGLVIFAIVVFGILGKNGAQDKD